MLLTAVLALPAFAQRRMGPPPGAGRPPMQRPQPGIDQGPQQRDSDNRPRRDMQQQQRGRGPHAGDWLRRYSNMSPEDQKKQLEKDPVFKQLPPDRQQKLRNRLDDFNHLSPDQKQRVLNRMEMFEHLSPEQQQRAQQLFGQFRTLPPESRQRVNFALRRLRTMSPEERQKVFNSESFKSSFSEQEQGLIKGLTDLGPATHDADPDVPDDGGGE